MPVQPRRAARHPHQSARRRRPPGEPPARLDGGCAQPPARNADSVVRRLEGAARGEVVDQYPGGRSRRAKEIDIGAARPAAELCADVLATSSAVDASIAQMPDAAWSHLTPVSTVTRRPPTMSCSHAGGRSRFTTSTSASATSRPTGRLRWSTAGYRQSWPNSPTGRRTERFWRGRSAEGRRLTFSPGADGPRSWPDRQMRSVRPPESAPHGTMQPRDRDNGNRQHRASNGHRSSRTSPLPRATRRVRSA